MTTTILAVLALTGSLVPAAKPEFQAQTDYSQALKLAAAEKKPMAVLIGKGDGFAKVLKDEKLTAEAKKLLSEKYVCVAVNTETEAGKALAGQFQLTDGGLVISSTGGTYQALRQSGAVSAAELSKYTETYANAPSTPATTVTAGAPVYSAAPVSYPSTSYYGGPVLSGGCPGGRCPTVITGGCPGGVCPTGGYSYPAPTFYGSSCPGGNCSGGSRFRR